MLNRAFMKAEYKPKLIPCQPLVIENKPALCTMALMSETKKITALLDARNDSWNAMALALDISAQSTTKWKNNGVIPKARRHEVARYLGVRISDFCDDYVESDDEKNWDIVEWAKNLSEDHAQAFRQMFLGHSRPTLDSGDENQNKSSIQADSGALKQRSEESLAKAKSIRNQQLTGADAEPEIGTIASPDKPSSNSPSKDEEDQA